MMGKGTSQSGRPPDELPTGWWADEMLGRLARYLRIMGQDTAYLVGLDDEEILERARGEHRKLLTRDRVLAQRAADSVLLLSVAIEGQWRELRRRFPTLPEEPRFERCTACNGALQRVPAGERTDPALAVPERVRISGGPLYRCDACAHVYWEGSHTASVRRRIAEWAGGRGT